MASSGDHRAQLLGLLRERAVLRGDFVLSSGQRSSWYLDARLVTLSAEGSPLVGRVFLDVLSETEARAVGGPAIGADPIVSAVAVLAGMSGRHLDGLIVRTTRKEHGAGRRIEGPWRSGLKVAVVDDTLTTGGSLLQAARAIEEEGGQVAGIYALIDREQGGHEAVEAAGYACRAIFRASELI